MAAVSLFWGTHGDEYYANDNELELTSEFPQDADLQTVIGSIIPLPTDTEDMRIKKELFSELLELIPHRGNSTPTERMTDIISRITGETDEFKLSGLIVVSISDDIIARRRNIYDRSQNFAEDVTRVNPEYQTLINPATGRPIATTKTLNDVLKKYHLRLCIYELPYESFDNNNKEGNCLENLVNEVYQKKGRNKALTIEKKDDYSIQDLIDFSDKNDTGLRLYTITGRLIHSRKPGKAKRPTINAMIFSNHIYPYTKPIRKVTGNKYKFTPKESDIRVTKVPNPATNGKYNIEPLNKFMTRFSKHHCNFVWDEEKDMTCQAIYLDRGATVCNYNIYDMNEAYYTVMYKIAYKDEKIPIFSIMDMFTGYKQTPIIPHAYYLINKEVEGLQTSLMHGFIVLLLIAYQIITRADIISEKIPSSFMTVGDFRNSLGEIPEPLVERNGKKRVGDTFRIYNGIMNVGYLSNWQYVHYPNCCAQTQEQFKAGICEDDVDLLEATHQRRAYVNDNKICVEGDKKFKNINYRNFYNFIIDRTNLEMLQLLYKYNDKVVKMVTDSLIMTADVGDISFFKKEIGKTRISRSHKMRMVTPPIYDLKWLEKIHMITGPPGSGKTYKIKNSVNYDYAMAYTNLAAINMNIERVKAETIHSTLKIYSNHMLNFAKFTGKIVWIDEFSMIPSHLWSYIYLVARYCELVYITGDMNQIPPVDEKCIFERPLYKLLLEGAEKLQTNYRNNAQLVQLREAVLRQDYTDLKKREMTGLGQIDTHIVLTNHYRSYMNDLLIKSYKLTCNIKDRSISKGMRLSAGISRKKLGIYKRDVWILQTDITPISTDFYLTSWRTKKTEQFQIQCIDYFEPAFAITAHSCQGLTIEGNILVHQYEKMIKIDHRILYTAITRVHDIENLFLCNELATYNKKANYQTYDNLKSVIGEHDDF